MKDFLEQPLTAQQVQRISSVQTVGALEDNLDNASSESSDQELSRFEVADGSLGIFGDRDRLISLDLMFKEEQAAHAKAQGNYAKAATDIQADVALALADGKLLTHIELTDLGEKLR